MVVVSTAIEVGILPPGIPARANQGMDISIAPEQQMLFRWARRTGSTAGGTPTATFVCHETEFPSHLRENFPKTVMSDIVADVADF